MPFPGPSRSIDSARDAARRARSGPRRRLRGPVRPADRPPRARGAGLLRDRGAHDAGRRDAGDGAEGDHPQRRPVQRLRGGRPRHRPGALRRRSAGLRDVLRLPADGPRPRWRGRPHRRAGVRPDPGPRQRARHPARRRPRRAPGVDVARRLGRAGPGGLHRPGVDRRHPGRSVRGPRPPVRRRAVAPRGDAHRARPARARALPPRHRRLPPDVDDAQHRRGAGRPDPRADRRGSRDLRPVRWRRLGRGRRDRAARDR